MPRFRIPGPLRRLSNAEITVEVGGADLGSAIVALDERYPGFRDRLLDEKGDLRQFVNVTNIRRADVTRDQGWVLLEITGEPDELERGVEYLESRGVKVEPAEGDVVVVGAGQAGLATSYYLTQAGMDHVVLEAGRVAETWRSRRWDSFCLVTPNWSVQLPGAPYAGREPDGYMPLAELVDHFQDWSDAFKAPVKEGCSVTSLGREGDGFTLRTDTSDISARTVVVATGGY